MPLLRQSKIVMVTSLPLLKQKLYKDCTRGGVLTDGEGREKGRWKMKERRGEMEDEGQKRGDGGE